MKRGLKAGIIATVVVIAFSIPSYFAYDFFSNVKDYKRTLVVRPREGTTGSQKVDVQAFASRPEGEKPAKEPVSDSDAGRNEAPGTSSNVSTAGNVINILFLGLDRTEERDRILGIYRSDTIAVARIHIDAKTVDVLSIPRDTYTYLPVTGKMDKINHAYAFGSLEGRGTESAIEAVELFINDEIDYFFTIDMEPVPEIIDSIGGIELDVESGIGNLTSGKQVLNGRQALGYVQWRYSSDGDIGRIRRQQKFAAALFDKLKRLDQLLNMARIALSYKENVTTNMTLKQIASLAMFAGELSGDSIEFHVIPGEGVMLNNIWYWIPDEEKTAQMLNEIFLKERVDNF